MKQEGQPSWDEAGVRFTTEPLLSSDLHNTRCAAGPCQLVTAAEWAVFVCVRVCVMCIVCLHCYTWAERTETDI